MVDGARGLLGEHGVVSGMRKNTEVYVWVNVHAAMDSGIAFFESENGVILCHGFDGLLASALPPGTPGADHEARSVALLRHIVATRGVALGDDCGLSTLLVDDQGPSTLADARVPALLPGRAPERHRRTGRATDRPRRALSTRS